MSEPLYNVTMYPADSNTVPIGIVLDVGELHVLNNGLNYGNGWFCYNIAQESTWFNLNEFRTLRIEEKGEKL